MRNIDMTALRSFAMVAETGGVTKAAGFLNLTQSAVSMQLKRLEESLDVVLLDRRARTVSLTGEGEQLLGYAQRMLTLNDEIYSRLTAQEFVGEIVLGVPHDIVYPAIPTVLRRFTAEFPRMRVQLISSFTMQLREQFSRGECDFIITTEEVCGQNGHTLSEVELAWAGAPGGSAWKSRPLPLAYERNCIFRAPTQKRLTESGIDWQMAVDSESSRTVEATVSADLAVHTYIKGMAPPHLEEINHGGALPTLQSVKINLYQSDTAKGLAAQAMADLLRQAFESI